MGFIYNYCRLNIFFYNIIKIMDINIYWFQNLHKSNVIKLLRKQTTDESS